MSDFQNDVLKLLEDLFEPGEVETLLWYSTDSYEDHQNLDAAVRIIHKPSGVEIASKDYDSPVKNKNICLVKLLKKLRAPT